METTPSPFTVVSPKRALKYLLVFLAFFGVVTIGLVGFVATQSKAPEDFPVNVPIVIKEGSSISDIVALMKRERVVQSEPLLYAIILTQYEPSDIKASTYVFDRSYNVFEVARKLATGDFTSNLVRLIHREGEPVKLLAKGVHETIPTISEEDFIALALPYEGKLLPETYFLPPHFTAEDVVRTLNKSYEDFMLTRRAKIAAGSLTEEEVIILASILEREAGDSESMGMVAGVFENRLKLDMPLQADASLEYVLDKSLDELTPADLKMDSPYNTYLNKGLPPTPISNPGREAIDAILEPTPHDYLFYITGNDGNFYYAVTYADHKRNIARYLK